MADEAGYLLARGDSRRLPLADGSVHCCVTSPPYFNLRDYGIPGQIGLERTPEAYVATMVEVFREVRRVLRDDGTAWLNLGDSYSSSPAGCGKDGVSKSSTLNGINGASGTYRETLRNGHGQKRDTSKIPGLKPKDLVGIPWRVALALQADGWYLRSDVIWAKPNPMPESVTDRPTKSHEYLFILSKSERYFYDAEAVREPHVDPARGTGVATGPGSSEADRKSWGIGGSTRVRSGCLNAMDRGGSGRQYNPAGRNRRTVWTVATEPVSDAHFATMPTRLVEPCVLAGTSERGVCPACGAPWVRVVDKPQPPAEMRSAKPADKMSYHTRAVNGGGGKIAAWYAENPGSTLGWQPSCSCPPAPPVPATVFDPFVGTGTTLLAACRLGRRGIGVDLSAAYLGIAARRIPDGLRPRSKLDPAAPARPLPGQMSFLDSLTPKEAPVE